MSARFVTPVGLGRNAFLTGFALDRHAVKLWLSRQDAAGIVEQVDRAASEALKAAHAQPGTRSLHAANPPYRLQPGGAYLFQFKSKPRPVLRDAAGNEITHCARIGDGSRITCTYTLEPFMRLPDGAGVQLRLHEVQLIELVAWQPEPETGERSTFGRFATLT